jgi:hypothetical protein
MIMDGRRRGWQASGDRLPLGAQHWPAERTFRPADIPAVRRFTQVFGRRTGMTSARLADFVLAVSEAAACATTVGPCTARVRLWMTGPRAFCEVRGNGTLQRRSAHSAWAGGQRGEEEALRRWVLRQVSDHVSVVSGPDGVWVLLSMTVIARGDDPPYPPLSAPGGPDRKKRDPIRPARGGRELPDDSGA